MTWPAAGMPYAYDKARRDTPRGPTATELRRRALAHNDEWSRLVKAWKPIQAKAGLLRCNWCGAASHVGCTNGPCSFHISST